MSKTVVGLYDHVSQARAAVQDLVDSGFDRNEINFVANAAAEEYGRYFDEKGKYRTDLDHHEMTSSEGASAGAGIGAAIGGIGGLLMGLGLLAVPGVGPALAAGPIVSTLVGAGVGAAAGGLMGALVNHGVPKEEAGHYAEGVRRGGSLVSLTVADDRVDEVEIIMNRHDPVDIDERVSDWRDTGYTGFDPKANPYTAREVADERARYMDTTADGVSYTPATSMGSSADDYRRHYDQTYANSGRDYAYYEPIYLFGTTLSGEAAFNGIAWSQSEVEARRRWADRFPNRNWEDDRDAVRYGYEYNRESVNA